MALAIVLAWPAAPGARAEFPYPSPPSGTEPDDYRSYMHTGPGQVPNDVTGKLDWMYSATPADPGSPIPDPLIVANNINANELDGVRGMHIVDHDEDVPTAWQTTTGRPDVVIAVLDSGIRWNHPGAMEQLRRKTWLNKGELEKPAVDRETALEPDQDCSEFTEGEWDANGDGVFNVLDYACDERVETDTPEGVGPSDVIDPQDILIAFSNEEDSDGNGFVDDIVGWDFLDDDNDPFDDVDNGHGTGEAQDSAAEADNGGDVGTCPNCMVMHMRVGDSFIADTSAFAQATIYGVDNGAKVIQEALGTLNNSTLAREAVRYAVDHGVPVAASAADENAQHNNWPSSIPGVVLFNSVTRYDEFVTPLSRSYLQFNGCTNFNAKIDVAVPSVSCSSDAVGRGAGVLGLIVSAAINAREAGTLSSHPTCRYTDGEACALSAHEIKQLVASGRIDERTMVDDVNFARDPVTGTSTELSCHPVPFEGCTNPFIAAENSRILETVSPVPTTRSYPAREGHDQFYGYGRANVRLGVEAAEAARIPPEVEVLGPEWFDLIDPARSQVQVAAHTFARGEPYRCRILVAPGAYPNNADTAAVRPGDFEDVSAETGTHCDGSERTAEHTGIVGTIDIAVLRARFPASTQAMGFEGREQGGAEQTHDGRPNTAPYGFVVKVVAETTHQAGDGEVTMTGEDRRQAFLHRDQDLLSAFPLDLNADGASSPLFVDLTGDNRNEMVFGTSDGEVHAIRRDGSALDGWPVRTDRMSLHTGGRAFAEGFVPADLGNPILASTAAGDLTGDGVPEIVAGDMDGKLYAWSAAGERLLEVRTNLDYSGRPLQPFENVRQGKRHRTQRAILGSPVLADVDGDGGLEIVVAAMDRHVYVWKADGSLLDGFPVLVVDREKISAIDPETHHVTFSDGGANLNQGAIITTPAVGDITGDGKPEIVVGTNEEYRVDNGTEGPHNAGALSAALLQPLDQAGLLDFANGRVYAIPAEGEPGGPDPDSSPYVDGWPVAVPLLMAELLPIVGEGINGSPVIGPVDCPEGGEGRKVGVIPAAGPGMILNPDGSSCYGQTDGRDETLTVDTPASARVDVAAIPAVGLPAFGSVLPGGDPVFLAPVAGVLRALDLAANESQGGQDGMGLWNASTGRFQPNWPSRLNDLQFLTGPAVADIDGQPGEEVIAGSATMDLAAFTAAGTPVNARWPKLTGDWTVATPLVGSFGTLDVADQARKVVAGLTRSGKVLAYETDGPACSPSSSPRFHHDNHNSGDFDRDAIAPGRPFAGEVEGSGSSRTIAFRAPGDDLLCGTADRYQVVHSGSPIDPSNFDDAEPLDVDVEPEQAGSSQRFELPAGTRRFVAIRAVDGQGNRGRPLSLDTSAPATQPPVPGPSGPSPPPPPPPGTAPQPPGPPGPERFPARPSAAQLQLACERSVLAIFDARAGRGRMSVRGVAHRGFAGHVVDVFATLRHAGRTRVQRIGRARVRRDGSFRTRGPGTRSARLLSRIRLVARVGRWTSRSFAVTRRLRIAAAARSGWLRVRGQISGPRGRGRALVRIIASGDCRTSRRVALVRADRRGRFTALVRVPRRQRAIVLRAASHVASRPGGRRLSPTFSQLRAVWLGS